MKNILKSLALGGLLAILSACAIQTNQMTVVNKTATIAKPKPGKALVVFMRPSVIGGAIQSTIYDGERYIGTLSAKTRIAYQATPGKHLFMVIGESADFMRANLVAGKTYYAIVFARPGFWKARFSFRPDNGQINASEIQNDLKSTQSVIVNAKGRAWAASHQESILQKRAEYLKKWMSKPLAEQQSLYAPAK